MWLEKQDFIDKESICAIYDKYSSVESIKKKLSKDFKLVYECPDTKEGISIKKKEDEEKKFSERSIYGELCRHIFKGKSLFQVAKYVAKQTDPAYCRIFTDHLTKIEQLVIICSNEELLKKRAAQFDNFHSSPSSSDTDGRGDQNQNLRILNWKRR